MDGDCRSWREEDAPSSSRRGSCAKVESERKILAVDTTVRPQARRGTEWVRERWFGGVLCCPVMRMRVALCWPASNGKSRRLFVGHHRSLLGDPQVDATGRRVLVEISPRCREISSLEGSTPRETRGEAGAGLRRTDAERGAKDRGGGRTRSVTGDEMTSDGTSVARPVEKEHADQSVSQ